ncbi:hypothetical protein [Pseudaminobacter sp. NGMCC 1.201702]|uniref:hypothetical protein n=1 Tax=Pseudaminobacter sp. NGMCC 1.201702 TaxID=3391825 RepID=UPI0039EF26C7
MNCNSACSPELTIDELLADPIVRTLMLADAVDEAELLDLLDRVGRHLHEPEPENPDRVT